MTLWTVGHSTRSADEFVALLQAHQTELIADVRRFAASRRHPHFSREQLEPMLASHRIDYAWMPALGGRRAPRKDSANTGWRVAAFRGYADYMETPEFAEALAVLLDIASAKRTAVMCAESLWWRCHRRMLSDSLTVAGCSVAHLMEAGRREPHRLTDAARVEDGVLVYDVGQQDLLAT